LSTRSVVAHAQAGQRDDASAHLGHTLPIQSMAADMLVPASSSRVRAACAILAALLMLVSASPAPALGRPADTARRGYVVVLKSGSDVTGTLRRHGVRARQVYGHAVKGFAAELAASERDALDRDPQVAFIEPDRVVRLAGQVLPAATNRVEADLAPVARIDGADQRVNADIAIIDTGIQPNHPDLNVVGGHNCINSQTGAWSDGNGHGTHVAGIAAALDNGIGTVGVAPGARLWSVRVFDSTGFSRLSWIVCGIDWVTAQNDPANPARPRIEVANMSLRDEGTDDASCGAINRDAEHAAICRAVARGVTYVVAAGNDATAASRWIPAAYNEVITVSALADYNGIGGGGARQTCTLLGASDADDTFANFSNYGSDVDLIAPGKCVYSTYPGSTYQYSSGTSMATPSVTGAAALYKSLNPGATPAAVRYALRAAGSFDWFTSSDPDGTLEPLLNVYGFGGAADNARPTSSVPIGSFVPGATIPTSGLLPLRVSWSGADSGGSGIAHYHVGRSIDGRAYTTVLRANAAARLFAEWRAPNHAYRYRVLAWDHAANLSAPATSAGWIPRAVQSTNSTVAYRGAWRTWLHSSAYGGGTRYSGAAGATATFRFTGRAIAWIAPLGRLSGAAQVYVDGRYVRTVNLYAAGAHPRRIVFEQRWAASGTHTISVRVAGTAGHPRVDVDAFLFIS
jgi:subtilisin